MPLSSPHEFSGLALAHILMQAAGLAVEEFDDDGH
jgi:hypothetical protein